MSKRDVTLMLLMSAFGGALVILAGGMLWGMWGSLLATGLVSFFLGWFTVLRDER